MQNYKQAVNYLENSLPPFSNKKCSWYHDALYHLALSYLRQTDSSELNHDELIPLFNQTEKTLQQALATSPNEKLYLTLMELYIAQAHRLHNDKFYHMANELLSKNVFESEDSRNQAALLLVSSPSSFQEKQKNLEKIIQKEMPSSSTYANTLYLQGINEYEQGIDSKKNKQEGSDRFFEKAAEYFAKAARLFEQISPIQSANAIAYEALSYYQHSQSATQNRALPILKQWIDEKKLNAPNEMYYLMAIMANDLLKMDQSIAWEEVEGYLLQGLTLSTNNKEKESILKSLGLLYLQHQQWDRSDECFEQFITLYPESNDSGEIWYWRARGAEHQENKERMKECFQRVYLAYPNCKYAPIAYFNYYSFHDYMHGTRKAIKHLQAMSQSFPTHPLLITSYYLIGLDHKKDRFSSENKLQRHRNLTAAIDAFQQAESTFDSLYRRNLIPKEELFYFTQIRYRAHLDRALANCAIAEESQGSKKHIYLEYATDVFKRICADFHDRIPPIDLLLNQNSYPSLWEESEFHLANVHLHKNEEEANNIFDAMLNSYRTIDRKEGYFLSHVWFKKAKIAQKHQDFEKALIYYDKAEKSYARLDSDEKLDLWIEQSHCYKGMHQLEDSMRILSKAVNDESISGLRLKAMFLRAEIYELQGKPELAQRQLEALSKKGGEWSLKAKNQLEQNRLP